MPSIYPFEEKEGKYFAPIVSNEPRYRISPDQNNPGPEATRTRDNIFVEPDTTQPMTEKAGTRGTFAIVRMVLPASTPETLRMRFNFATCEPYNSVVGLTYTRVPDAEAANLRFASVGYWRGTGDARPEEITPTPGVPVWVAQFEGQNYYIFYIETDLVTTDGFAWGTTTSRVGHAGTGFITREITDPITWTTDCDILANHRTEADITPGTLGPAQQKGELFAVNTQSFLSSN